MNQSNSDSQEIIAYFLLRTKTARSLDRNVSQAYFLKFHFNIILRLRRRLPSKWLISFGFLSCPVRSTCSAHIIIILDILYQGRGQMAGN